MAQADRLDRPPPPGAYLDLSESFGRRFAVFVDTEEEFDWYAPLSRDQRSTRAIRALPPFHRRLVAHGVKPVYLVDHPVATDSECSSMLRGFSEAGECAVGAQLHPWVNPPFEEEVKPCNSFPGNLSIELERAKLAALTDAITAATGRRPIVYRAGRYGVGPNTAAVLAGLGYRVDTSVRALHDYRAQGGPDFRFAEPRPWRVAGGLLEVPLSATYIGRLRKGGGPLYRLAGRVPRGRGLLARTGLVERVSLTPEEMPLDKAIEAAGAMLADGARLLALSFHSPSLEPGHTPYVRSEADLRRFHAWWEGLFAFLDRRGVAPASIEEILAAAGARP